MSAQQLHLRDRCPRLLVTCEGSGRSKSQPARRRLTRSKGTRTHFALAQCNCCMMYAHLLSAWQCLHARSRRSCPGVSKLWQTYLDKLTALANGASVRARVRISNHLILVHEPFPCLRVRYVLLDDNATRPAPTITDQSPGLFGPNSVSLDHHRLSAKRATVEAVVNITGPHAQVRLSSVVRLKELKLVHIIMVATDHLLTISQLTRMSLFVICRSLSSPGSDSGGKQAEVSLEVWFARRLSLSLPLFLSVLSLSLCVSVCVCVCVCVMSEGHTPILFQIMLLLVPVCLFIKKCVRTTGVWDESDAWRQYALFLDGTAGCPARNGTVAHISGAYRAPRFASSA